MSGTGFSWEQKDGREDANAWVARFAPLLMEDGKPLSDAEVRSRLALVGELKQEGPAVRQRLCQETGGSNDELLETFDRAYGQLDSMETDLRRRLARTSPGDPAGIVDLDSIQEKLDERAARQEIGAPTDSQLNPVLEMPLSGGNIAGAAVIGVFALGWLTFTTFHMSLMVGGMFKAFGAPALALIGFYAIFFLAGGMMALGAVNAASSENIVLSGRHLKVIRRLGGWVRTKEYLLPPDACADVTFTSSQAGTNRRMSEVLVLNDANGRQITLGTNSTHIQRRQACDRINEYLKAQA